MRLEQSFFNQYLHFYHFFFTMVIANMANIRFFLDVKRFVLLLHQESLRPLNRACSLLHSATSTRRVVVYWRVEWRKQRSPRTSKTHRHTLAYANKFYSALLCREPTRDGYYALSSLLSPRFVIFLSSARFF